MTARPFASPAKAKPASRARRRAICMFTSLVKEHPIFTRHNNDLVCQVPISFHRGGLGAVIDVPTLKGSESLDIPAGTQHGEVFKLKGKGLPDVRTYRNGDELVQITIEVPRKVERPAETVLLREFAATEDARLNQERKGFLGQDEGPD
jgi:molecular chaperone DnaJ